MLSYYKLAVKNKIYKLNLLNGQIQLLNGNFHMTRFQNSRFAQ